MNFNKLPRVIFSFMKKRSPEILLAAGGTGFVFSTVLAVKATPKAIDKMKAKAEELGHPLTKKEVVKTAWKCYIPSATAGVTSACLLAASSIVSHKRYAALYAALTLTETAYNEYRNQNKIIFGEENDKKIESAMAEDIVENDSLFEDTGNGTDLCIETWSGRKFLSSIEAINAGVNKFNDRLNRYDCLSLNELFDDLGLDPCDSGELFEFDRNDGLLEVRYNSVLIGNKSYISVSFRNEPKVVK